MANIKKNAEGYGYKYTDLAEIHNWLESQGITYRQEIEVIEGNDYIVTTPIVDGKEQKPVRGCRVTQATLSGIKNPAQEQGSALTYARRYSLLMAFGLATTDDDAACMTLKLITKAQVKTLTEIAKKKGSNIDGICKAYKVKKLEEMTEKDYGECLNILVAREDIKDA
jgi:hypothetical protein